MFHEPCQHSFDAGSLHRLNTADIEVVHQGCNAAQAGSWISNWLGGFEGDAVTDMAEVASSKSKPRHRRTVYWAVDPGFELAGQ